MKSETEKSQDNERPLAVAVTGATGMVGSRLTEALEAGGHRVVRISRGSAATVRWDPEVGRLDAADLENIDAVVHLAGEPIAQRWTKAARERILNSRRKGTRLLAETVAYLKRPPKVFVSMSGVNAYGASHPEPVHEESPRGDGFLAEVCREWEGATDGAKRAGIRTVIVRSGMVLGSSGGALAKLLPVFRLGLGGPIGMGERWMSWIAIDDLVAILSQAIRDERYQGVINGVAPDAVRNREFTAALGETLRRPAKIPVPPALLRLAFGQMAEETILGDLRVVSRRLPELGFRFAFPELRGALEHLVGERRATKHETGRRT